MAAPEHPSAPLSLRERLLLQLPKGFMREEGLSDTGIYPDYYNTYSHWKPIFDTMQAKPERREEGLLLIQRTLKGVQTYSDYIRERAEIHNKRAEETGFDTVDVDEMVRILATEVPTAVLLDEIAIKLRAIADTENFASNFPMARQLLYEAENLRKKKDSEKEGQL